MFPFHTNKTMHFKSVTLLVKDLNESKNFYQNLLGLSVLKETENGISFTANGKTALVTIKSHNHVVAKKGFQVGLYHFALLFPTRKSLAHVFMHLIQKGYDFTGFSDHGVSEAIYLNDPDGNGIELYYDRPSNMWPMEYDNITMYTEPLDYEDLLKQTPAEPFTKISPYVILGHLHLHVKNLNVAEEFFVNTLNFDIIIKYGNSALFMSDSEYHHHIATNTWAGNAPERQVNEVGLMEYEIFVPREKWQTIKTRLFESDYEMTETEDDKPSIIDINGTTVVFTIE